MEVQGWLYKSLNSQRHSATLHYADNGIVSYHINEGSEGDKSERDEPEVIHSFDIGKLDITNRVGNTPRFIHFPDHCKFESNDNKTIDAIILAASHQGHIKRTWVDQWAHTVESNRKFIAFTILLVAIASGSFVQYGIPYFSKEFAMILPAKVVAKIGSGSLEILDNSVMQASNLSEERKQILRNEFESLKENLLTNKAKEDSIPLHIVFRSSEQIGANAFALPSGNIIFTDEMIKLAKNDDELKIIMLHEMGHVANRHSLRKLIQQSSLAVLIILVTGDVSTTSSMILALPSMLLNARFSQDMETEADTFALNHLAQNHLDGQHFVNIMNRLEASLTHVVSTVETTVENTEQSMAKSIGGSNKPERHAEQESVLSSYFTSHPATAERITRFQNAR